MSRRRSENSTQNTRGAASRGAAASAAARGRRELRETMEAVAVAFILAFLFRTFEAEAFVIPTGSMAPTLFGRHKDVECPQCGYHFQAGASEELDQQSVYLIRRIDRASCPNCRFEVEVLDEPVFTGDRILVNKFPYEIGEPARWDVFVFKYPEDPKTNYIKRLVGLPEETIEIRQGDLYGRHDDGTASILRKDDPRKQQQLQILVYDNDFPERPLHENGWPERWSPVVPGDEAPDSLAGWSAADVGWQPDPDRSFRLQAQTTADRLHWIRYRHIVPTPADWHELQTALEAGRPPVFEPAARLISDYCAYNESRTVPLAPHPYFQPPPLDDRERDAYWVGDLTVSFQLDVTDRGAGGELLVELVEGERVYRCRFDLETGAAAISHNDPLDPFGESWTVLATAQSGLLGAGSYAVSFANVDDRLVAWVDGRVVPFGEAAEYQPHRAHDGGIQRPGELDLIPVGIAARGVSARVSRLLVQRDIYYRADHLDPRDQHRPEDREPIYESPARGELHRSLSDPDAWFETYRRTRARDVTFRLGPDEFLALGDNSPRSKDSRLWSNLRRDLHRHAVPRSALVGKAFFTYWPHGVPFLNDGRGFPVRHHRTPDGRRTDYPSFRVPFYPNVERMTRIR